MKGPLDGRTVLLIVGGGIAAYKSVFLVREILRAGAAVETVLTPAAQRFVTGVTFSGITGRPARMDLWDPSHPGELHIDLTSRADAVVVAPATADLLARSSLGLADDLATTCLSAVRGPALYAPAMHPRMWNNPATQEAVEKLKARGATIVGPAIGALASGETGIGRMSEPDVIAAALMGLLGPQDLLGVRVLVTAGPTQEAMDPVRYIGNRSSGRMGYAVADRARLRGASVTLVSGPVAIEVPAGVEVVRVQTAMAMREAVVRLAETTDVVVMAAAVADYRPETVAIEKLKKVDDTLTLRLVRNPDILKELGIRRGERASPVLVGFAVETGDLTERAREKLVAKCCDLVVANLAADGFDGAENVVTLVTAEGEQTLNRRPKTDVADKILDRVRGMLDARAARG